MENPSMATAKDELIHRLLCELTSIRNLIEEREDEVSAFVRLHYANRRKRFARLWDDRMKALAASELPTPKPEECIDDETL